MFCKVMTLYPEICKKVTELITGRKIRSIVQPDAQRVVEITRDSRGVRFDVYFEDDENSMYDVEMQNYREEAPLKRARYNQAMVDLACLERGSRFTDLKESYIIFIGVQDYFKADEAIYRFETICEVLPKEVNTGAHLIFVNAKGMANAGNESFANLLRFIEGNVPRDALTREISLAVQEVAGNPQFRREYMTLQEKLDNARQEGLEKGLTEGRNDALISLVTDGLLTVTEAAKRAGMDEHAFRQMMEQATA